jgi:hypothetical protein
VHTRERLRHRQVDPHERVHAGALPAAWTSGCVAEGEEVEDVVHAAEAGERVAAGSRCRRVRVTAEVDHAALVRVGEHLVGDGDLLEALLGTRVGVYVRVQLTGQPAVRALDLLGCRVTTHAEHGVVVANLLRQRRTSPVSGRARAGTVVRLSLRMCANQRCRRSVAASAPTEPTNGCGSPEPRSSIPADSRAPTAIVRRTAEKVRTCASTPPRENVCGAPVGRLLTVQGGLVQALLDQVEDHPKPVRRVHTAHAGRHHACAPDGVCAT